MSDVKVSVSSPDAKLLAMALARADRPLRRAMAKSNRDVARQARQWARSDATAGTKLQARAAGGIGSSATATAAKLTVRPTTRAPMARVAFWGAKRRTGWNARHRDSRPQHPAWVGSSWQVAQKGQGPYIVNDMLAERTGEIGDLYLEGQWDVLMRATRSRSGR